MSVEDAVKIVMSAGVINSDDLAKKQQEVIPNGDKKKSSFLSRKKKT